MQDGAAGGARASCGVHHQIGAAFVGDGHDQFIGIVQLRRVFCRLLAAVEKCHGFPSSDAFDGNGHDDSVPRHADKQAALLLADERFCFFLICDAENHALFVAFNAQNVQHTAHSRAVCVKHHVHGDRQLRADLRQDFQRSGITN